MKKLSNVSPFLLLLVPIFVMMLFSLTPTSSNQNDDEVALKSSSSKISLIKISNPFSK